LRPCCKRCSASPRHPIIYYEQIGSKPRMAVAVGEKYFVRAGNSLAATALVIEDEGRGCTRVKVVATGARSGLLDFLDLGPSRDYTRRIVEKLAELTGADYTVVAEVDRLDSSKAEALW
jgi:hypothetical protein